LWGHFHHRICKAGHERNGLRFGQLNSSHRQLSSTGGRHCGCLFGEEIIEDKNGSCCHHLIGCHHFHHRNHGFAWFFDSLSHLHDDFYGSLWSRPHFCYLVLSILACQSQKGKICSFDKLDGNIHSSCNTSFCH